MAIDATVKAAFLKALADTQADAISEFDAYVESLVALNQLNSEVIAELNAVHSTGDL